jgi:hypothetical protein
MPSLRPCFPSYARYATATAQSKIKEIERELDVQLFRRGARPPDPIRIDVSLR